MSQEFSDRVQIHTGHYQSTGEGMSVAMPGIVLESCPLDRAQEPLARRLRIGEDEIAIEGGTQLFESSQSHPIERNIPRIAVLSSGQIQLPALEIDMLPHQAALLAHPDSGVNRKQRMRMEAGIGRLEQGMLLRI
jgi:hypothetical protein